MQLLQTYRDWPEGKLLQVWATVGSVAIQPGEALLFAHEGNQVVVRRIEKGEWS